MEDVMKHEMEPYFDEDVKANDWVKSIMPAIRWELFRNQEDWVYMAGDLGKRRNPMTRGNAIDYIYDTVKYKMNTLIYHITMELLHEYHDDDIDFDTYTAQEYNEYFEYTKDDEGYAKDMGVDPGFVD